MEYPETGVVSYVANFFKNIVKAIKPWGRFQRRDAASRTGSMSNWQPRTTQGDTLKDMERDEIVNRSVNLVHDDPNAAGIIDTFATTITGAGLRPLPALNPESLGITPEQARAIESEQKAIYKEWSPHADAGQRMTDGEIQHLKTRNLFEYGESLEIIYMIDDPFKSFAMASLVINPTRLKTPSNLTGDDTVKHGIKLGKYGEPIGYWIQKAGGFATDSSNFVYIPAKKGHRWQVLHDFIVKDPEQMRGDPILSTGMRFFRDFSDLLGAELTSNVVTAALAYFIKTDSDSALTAENLLDQDQVVDDRYQSVAPGEILYGNKGDEMDMLDATRPGTTFDPFTKIIKKAIAQGTGVPFNIAFKELDGVTFAGFRAAMLEAWRVFSYHRTRIGNRDLQKKYTMLMEEAWSRGRLSVGSDFLEKMHLYTAAEWFGAPKGDIEPFKAAQADILKVNNNIKTLERSQIEDGGVGFTEITDQRAEENQILETKGLPVPGAVIEPESDSQGDNTDDD